MDFPSSGVCAHLCSLPVTAKDSQPLIPVLLAMLAMFLSSAKKEFRASDEKVYLACKVKVHSNRRFEWAAQELPCLSERKSQRQKK